MKPAFLIALVAASVTTLVAASVTLQWNPNNDPDLGGYRLYHGPGPRAYTRFNFTTNTEITVPIEEGEGVTHFAVVAVSSDGAQESEFSDEVVFTNSPTIRVTLHFEEACDASGPFETLTNTALSFTLPLPEGARFYRGRVEINYSR